MIMQRSLVLAISALAFLLSAPPISGCISGNMPASEGSGYLAGNVTVGPLTPMERAGVTVPPPDPAVFTSRHLLLYKSDGKTLVQQIDIQPAGYYGTYNVTLSSGTYVLDLSRSSGVGTAGRLPATVSIEAGRTKIVDVDIDTGIR